jgi:hypothetical protein
MRHYSAACTLPLDLDQYPLGHAWRLDLDQYPLGHAWRNEFMSQMIPITPAEFDRTRVIERQRLEAH